MPTKSKVLWMARNTRITSPWRQGAPQRNPAVTTKAIPEFHINTPRDVHMSDAAATTPTVVKASARSSGYEGEGNRKSPKRSARRLQKVLETASTDEY